jgi:hypothetical protein
LLLLLLLRWLLLPGGNAEVVRLLLENASRLPQDFKTKEGWSSNLLQVQHAQHICNCGVPACTVAGVWSQSNVLQNG